MEHKRRSSRSGSLVNTPDHQPKQMTVPVGKLFSFDDSGETSNYLEANDSSATNSSCSFDAPPDVPPVPPRVTNPPPRNTRMATGERLIIIDMDVNIDARAPIPAARAKASKMQISMTTINNTTTAATTAKPPIFDRNTGFENSFVSNVNSLNIQKNNNGVNGARPQPHIDPPPKHMNHKLNMTNETKTSEVRRISSKSSTCIIEVVLFEKINGCGKEIFNTLHENHLSAANNSFFMEMHSTENIVQIIIAY